MKKGQSQLLFGIVLITIVGVSLAISYLTIFKPNILINQTSTTTSTASYSPTTTTTSITSSVSTTTSAISTTTSQTTTTSLTSSTTSITSSTTTTSSASTTTTTTTIPENLPDSEPAVGNFVGGSNYVMISTGNYKNTCQGWYEGELEPVIGFYHLEQQKVRNQLNTMYENGQRKIILFLWYMHFGQLQGSVYGHVLKSDGGNLVPQHQENLRNLVKDVKSAGFNEIIFRFATQGGSYPGDWTSWNETLYQENFNFILNTRKIVNEAWCGNENTCNGNGLKYDLDAEFAGDSRTQAANYQKKLWNNYTTDAGLGKADTIGFSFIGDQYVATRINSMLNIYDSSRVGRPNIYTFDIYSDATTAFTTAHNTLVQKGASSESLIVLESYYNDIQEMNELRSAIQQTGRNVLFLAQWPYARNSKCMHFSVDYPENYTNYLAGIVSANPSYFALSSGTIGKTVISWNTTIYSVAQVWVSVNGQGEVLFAQSKSGSQEANWIVCPNSYKFALYAETSHSIKLSSITVTSSCK